MEKCAPVHYQYIATTTIEGTVQASQNFKSNYFLLIIFLKYFFLILLRCMIFLKMCFIVGEEISFFFNEYSMPLFFFFASVV